MFDLECIATTLDDVMRLQETAASAIELCVGMAEGGLTPPLDTVVAAGRMSRLPVRAMVRPTARDFCYTAEEFTEMLATVDSFATTAIEGLVVGILNPDYTVDTARMREVIRHARGKKITFHRAIEETPDLGVAWQAIAACGIDSILVSRVAGLDALPKTPVRLRVGGGVRAEHLPDLARRGFTRIHMGSAIREDGTFTSAVSLEKIQACVNG